jgi:transposase
VAVAHRVVVLLSHLLRDHRPYSDLGANYFDQLDRQRVERHHVRRLQQLGYTVTLTPASAA